MMEPGDLKDFYTFVIWKKINSVGNFFKEGYLKGSLKGSYDIKDVSADLWGAGYVGGHLQAEERQEGAITSDQVLRNPALLFCTWPVLLKDPVSSWSFLVSTVLGALSGGFQVLVQPQAWGI